MSKITDPVFVERNRKWLAALRSGEFRQAKNVLKQAKGHCCLGVACEIYLRETGNGEWQHNVFTVDGTQGGCVPPAPVWEWFGWSNNNPAISGAKKYGGEGCIWLNDNNVPFPEIADAFEQEYLA